MRPEGAQPALFDDEPLLAADDAVSFHVLGMPRPQGSLKIHRLPGGKVATRYANTTYEWRAQVTAIVLGGIESLALAVPLTGALEVRLGFDLPRPQGHFGTGRNAGAVKPSSPIWPAVMPDIDKLTRSILDSCTDAGLWKDDSQVCVLHVAKRYGAPSGVLIQVRRA